MKLGILLVYLFLTLSTCVCDICIGCNHHCLECNPGGLHCAVCEKNYHLGRVLSLGREYAVDNLCEDDIGHNVNDERYYKVGCVWYETQDLCLKPNKQGHYPFAGMWTHPTGPGRYGCGMCTFGKYRTKFHDETAQEDCVQCPVNTYPGTNVHSVSWGSVPIIVFDSLSNNFVFKQKDGYNSPHTIRTLYDSSHQISPEWTQDTDLLYSSFDCFNCAPGKFRSDLTTTECITCPPGETYDENITTCGKCLAGKYENLFCVDCLIGTYTTVDGSTACEKSSPGHYIAYSNMPYQSQCPIGTFQDKDGQSFCHACAAGTYNSKTGQSSCQNSTPGYYVADDAATYEVPCPATTFSDKPGSIECNKCPPLMDSWPGSTVCDTCNRTSPPSIKKMISLPPDLWFKTQPCSHCQNNICGNGCEEGFQHLYETYQLQERNFGGITQVQSCIYLLVHKEVEYVVKHKTADLSFHKPMANTFMISVDASTGNHIHTAQPFMKSQSKTSTHDSDEYYVVFSTSERKRREYKRTIEYVMEGDVCHATSVVSNDAQIIFSCYHAFAESDDIADNTWTVKTGLFTITHQDDCIMHNPRRLTWVAGYVSSMTIHSTSLYYLNRQETDTVTLQKINLSNSMAKPVVITANFPVPGLTITPQTTLAVVDNQIYLFLPNEHEIHCFTVNLLRPYTDAFYMEDVSVKYFVYQPTYHNELDLDPYDRGYFFWTNTTELIDNRYRIVNRVQKYYHEKTRTSLVLEIPNSTLYPYTIALWQHGCHLKDTHPRSIFIDSSSYIECPFNSDPDFSETTCLCQKSCLVCETAVYLPDENRCVECNIENQLYYKECDCTAYETCRVCDKYSEVVNV